MRVDLFDFDLPETASRSARWSRAMPRACSWSGPGPAFEDRIVRDLPDLLQPGRRSGAQRHQGHSRRGSRPARARGDGGPGRDHAAQARGRGPLARLRAAGQGLDVGDRIRFGEAREHGLRARAARCRGGGERARAATSRLPSPSPARFSTRRSPGSASCRCRPISPASGRRRAGPRSTTRPSTPRTRARSRRRPRACISPTSCSAGSTSAASPAIS